MHSSAKETVSPFAAALRRRLGENNRREFAAKVAEVSGETVTEAAVSLWLLGRSEPSRHKVFAMEEILQCAPGTLSQHLGYLPVNVRSVPDVPSAIEADPSLSNGAKRVLLAAYEAAVGRQESVFDDA